MKKIIYFFIFLSFNVQGQNPATFNFTPTNSSATFYGQLQINGISADANDWIAAFDEDTICAGANQITIYGGIAYTNLVIYGDDITTPNIDEGINVGEDFSLHLYDASSDTILIYKSLCDIISFSGWTNTNGAPMSGYNNPSTIYDFITTSLGCTDSTALNYNPLACLDDSSCVYCVYGCTDSTAFNYNSLATCDDGSCIPIINGCTDSTALNYYAAANIDNGSCIYCTNDTSYTNITACDSVIWNSLTYSASGTYIYLTTDTVGCDSTAILNLTINNSTSTFTSVTACDSYTWSVNGVTYPSSGLYTDTSTNASGCLHTDSLNLTINYTTSSTIIDTVCDSYTWNGQVYTTSVIDSAVFTNTNGCDSTAVLNLTINQSDTSYSNITVCDSVVWNGVTYSVSGTYTYLTTDTLGCDSIAILNLTINSNATFTLIQTACDSFLWNGTTYTVSGIYLHNSINPFGCPSADTLVLTINNSTTSILDTTVCGVFGGISWNGMYFNTTGTYTYNTTGINGCDSTAILNLTIGMSHTWYLSPVRCNSYTWNGTTYTTSTLIVDTLVSSVGCDSIVIVNLTINNSSTSTTSITACNTYYTWPVNGQTYTASGTYWVITGVNIFGCTVVDSLVLTIGGIFGCTDSTACNYDSLATCDDGSCLTAYGCMDSTALNYNSSATCDDGSCVYCVYGCIDSTACNYNSLATCDDGSCLTAYGCMDTTQFNYNPLATCDDGSCIPITYGCTDSTALNYYAAANVDDGSCTYCVYGCMDTTQFNYNPLATCDNGSCIPITYGCTDSTAINYYAAANVDDGSCTYVLACNSPVPTGLSVTDLTHDRAKVNWLDANTSVCLVEMYRVQYREQGTTAWSTKTALGSGLCNFGLTTTSKMLWNLTPSTVYEYRAKAWYCLSSASTWSSISTFTTLDPCPNVLNFAVSTPLTTKAVFTWTAPSAPYSFVRIKLRVDSVGSAWFTAGGFGVMYPALTRNKNGLTPGQSYRASSRTWCNPLGGPHKALSWSSFIYWTQPGTLIRIDSENSSIENLTIYPNPSRDIFNITFISEEKQNLRVRILNVIGEEVYKEDLQQFVGEYVKSINLEQYNKAIYFLEIETDDGVINKKLILQ